MTEQRVTVIVLCDNADNAAIVVREALEDLCDQEDRAEFYDFEWEIERVEP